MALIGPKTALALGGCDIYRFILKRHSGQEMKNQSLRVVALGRFSEPLPPLSHRLAQFGVEPQRCETVEGLPAELARHEILLADLDWLRSLAPAARAELSRRAAPAAGWIALTGDDAAFKEQVDWQRAGVRHFFRKPLDPERLATLIEDIHDRLNGPPVRAILLDDEESALAYYGAALRQAGVVVETTTDPLLVVEVIAEFKPDLLLVDIEMPGCRGPELVAIIRQRAEYAQLPVLFLTAMEGMSDLLLARQAAAEDFLPKPVAPELLLAAVQAQAWRHRSRQRAEALQRRQEARAISRLEQLRLAVDEHAIVSVVDAKGNILRANDKFCAISGYRREELIGQNQRIVKSGAHPPEFYAEMWRTLAAGRIWHGELCNQRKDGSPYWIESTIVPFFDGGGQPAQYISILTDITLLKEREAALHASDERLRRSQEFANIGTWDWSIRSGELYWSERIAPLFGHEHGQLASTYENFLAAVHPDDRQAVVDAVNASVASDAPYDIEHRVVWPDGTVRWLHEKGAVVRDAAGQPLNMLGVVQDIHERKMAEEQLALFRRVFDASDQAIGIADSAGCLIYMNRAHESMLGYAREECLGRPFAMFHCEADQARIVAAVMAAAQTGKGYSGLLPMQRKDGSVFTVAASVGFVKDAHGQIQYAFNAFTDFSAELARREELARAKEEAERSNRAKSDFLSSMSHELRTPLNAIIGFSQMLEYDGALAADQLDNVHEILKAGHHLLALINEVLDLAKIEAGRVDLSLEAVALAPLFEDCRQLIQPLAARRDIRLEVEAGEEAVFADRTRLKQVLLNLLSNAVKYNRESGAIRLTVGDAQEARHWRIVVADTGPGITAEKQRELFQPFNRLGAEYGDIEGTGIGLTISRRLIDMMGGEIGVDSAAGAGSRFWIELPREAAVAPAGAEAAPEKLGAGGAAAEATGKRHTVLCIDDNPVNLKLIAQMLGRRQHIHLLTAHTPELGIELALTRQPELILLDINMPGMDGYQVLEVFKAEARLKRIPVIAVTANALPADIARGKAAGFADYLTKPLEVDQFIATIDAHLKLRKGNEA